MCPHVCCQVSSATSLHSAKSQSVASSGTPQGPSPSTGPPHPATARTHVPSRAMCRVRSIPTSDPLLHASYCEYRPTSRSIHEAMHVISHNDTPKAKATQTVSDSNTGFTMPFVVQSTVEAKQNLPVLGESERVATNFVLHQRPSRR